MDWFLSVLVLPHQPASIGWGISLSAFGGEASIQLGMIMFKLLVSTVVVTGFLSMTLVAQEFDVQGHRGARGLAPENTLAAFARALTIGVSTLEFDVGISSDSIVVVTHNPRLEPETTRRSDGTWLSATGPAIRTLNIKDLGAYDVGRIKPGSRYAERFSNQTPADGSRIPTLKEVIELVLQSGNEKVRLNIEAKLDPTKPDLTHGPEKFASAILDVVLQAGMTSRVTIQSFDWRVLQEVQRRAPKVETSYLTVQQRWLDNLRIGETGPSPWTAGFDIDNFDGSIPRLVKEAGGRVWSPYHREINPAQVKEAHDLDLTVKVWTVNEEKRMKALIEMDVDGIITDYPDRLRRVLEMRGMNLPTPTPVQP